MLKDRILDLQRFADGGAAGGDGGGAAGAGEAAGAGAPEAGAQEGRKRRETPGANVRQGPGDGGVAGAKKRRENPRANVRQGSGEAAAQEGRKRQIGGTRATWPGRGVQNGVQAPNGLGRGAQYGMEAANGPGRGTQNGMEETRAGGMGAEEAQTGGIGADQARAGAQDDAAEAAQARSRGMGADSLEAIARIERENAWRQRQTMAEARLRAHFNTLAQQAEAARQLYPGLNLGAEMRNPLFARLTSPGVGVDVRTAYEVVHREQMRGAEMQFAAMKSAERMANAIRSGSLRPVENGLQGQQGNGAVRADPKFLSKDDREEIRRRVRRGEKIVF